MRNQLFGFMMGMFALSSNVDGADITIKGIPVQWCSTRSAGARTVAIANHSGEAWRGTVQVRDLLPQLRYCQELRSRRPLTFQIKDSVTRLDLSIPAYDVEVVR